MFEQLALPFSQDAEFLRKCLEKNTGKTFNVTLTDNTSRFLSVKWNKETAFIRLQRIFLDADEDILREIAGFICNTHKKIPLTREFIRQNSFRISGKANTYHRFQTKGKYYDLNEIFQSLNRKYFEPKLTCQITWSRHMTKRFVRKRTLGSYTSVSDTIRINSVLDRKHVPRCFMAFVVYHEMLHAAMGTETINGRRSIHPKEFRVREQLYHDYERAVLWERTHFH